MSPLRVFNTLTARKEDFVPQTGNAVRIYACGPTVYDLIHIGNARMVIVWDVIQRYLRFSSYDVTFVRNITDIDDKIINRAKELNWRPEQVAREYTYTFWKDMHRLNVAQPDFEPRATEFIHPMISFVSNLIDIGHAYVAGGDVYFEVSTFKEYGKLKKQKLDELVTSTREQVRSQEELAELKRSPLDFALWKRANPNEPGWDSPWGRGRPGWHLECSTMIKHVLGETIDIHGGGEDLTFPHHENEIAQSESLHNKPLARYWLHNGFVQIDAEKMSKSLGNFRTVDDILQTYSPDTVRLFFLQTHYRSPVDFSSDGLAATMAGLQRLIRATQAVSQHEADYLAGQHAIDDSDFTKAVMRDFRSQFTQAMDNDFNTAAAVALLFTLADKVFQETEAEQRLSYIYALKTFSGVLGLTLEDTSHQLDNKTAEGVLNLVLSIRQTARDKKDYSTSDLIRDQLATLGIKIMDTTSGGHAWEHE
ncbi:MAG: cysteine--tRNA ligase [Candidatus Melainabacteria bacterium]|nr:cysteine--tRNA ligase [Candidatus Melainabacteria bacterium]